MCSGTPPRQGLPSASGDASLYSLYQDPAGHVHCSHLQLLHALGLGALGSGPLELCRMADSQVHALAGARGGDMGSVGLGSSIAIHIESFARMTLSVTPLAAMERMDHHQIRNTEGAASVFRAWPASYWVGVTRALSGRRASTISCCVARSSPCRRMACVAIVLHAPPTPVISLSSHACIFAAAWRPSQTRQATPTTPTPCANCNLQPNANAALTAGGGVVWSSSMKIPVPCRAVPQAATHVLRAFACTPTTSATPRFAAGALENVQWLGW